MTGLITPPAKFRDRGLAANCDALQDGMHYVTTTTTNKPSGWESSGAAGVLSQFSGTYGTGVQIHQELTQTGGAGIPRRRWSRIGRYVLGSPIFESWVEITEGELTWTEATLQSNLTNVSTYPVRYAKAGNIVHIQGRCNVTDYKIDTAIFTLPTGYRPEKVSYFGGCFYDNTTGLMYEGMMQVNSSGDVESVVTRPNYSIPAYSNFILCGSFALLES